MITNKKSSSLQFYVMLFIMFSSFTSYGQWGEIIKIEKDGVLKDSTQITIAKQDGKTYKSWIYIKTPSHSSASKIESGTIVIINPNTTIRFKSANTNELEIKAEDHEKIIEYLVTKYHELYRSMDANPSGNIFAEVFQKLAGDVRTANRKNNLNGGSKSTKWEITFDNNNVSYRILEGKVAISGRSKIEMEDDIIKLEGNNKRLLYVTEVIDILSPTDKTHPYNPDSLSKPALITDVNKNKFFKTELKKQRRLLRASGPHTKTGYKFFEKGQYEDGITEYTKAIEFGEIDADRFIQASLILTEAYHEMKTKKTGIANSGFQSSKIKNNLDTWLDASLHFSKKADSINKIKYENFRNNGNKKIAKAYGYDLVLSKEYQAWAYTVKLKLNGCLESTEQNPLVLMKEISKLKDTLKTY